MTEVHLLLGVGLPTFLVVSLALSVRRPTPQPTGAFIRRRLDRIGRPWLFWSTAFAGLQTVSALRHGKAPFSWWVDDMWLSGPGQHLWFMPALFLLGIAAHGIDRATQGVPGRLLVGCCFVVTAIVFAVTDVPNSVEGAVAAYVFCLPALPLAVAVGRTLARSGTHDQLRRRLLILLAAIMLLALPGLFLHAAGGANVQLRYLLALCSMAVVLYVPLPFGRISTSLRHLLLGCYVLHPLVRIQIGMRAAERFHLAPVVEAIGVVALTIVLVALLRRSFLHRVWRVL